MHQPYKDAQPDEVEGIPLQGIQRNRNQEFINDPVKQKVFDVFHKYDYDNDGYLSVRELQQLIRESVCRDIPASTARRIIKIGDRNGDGQLNFEEFYKIWMEKRVEIYQYVQRYCKIVVPPRIPRAHHVADGSVDAVDGAYEDKISFCPPPLTMLIFSIIEIIFFVVDIVYLEEHKGDHKNYGTTVNGPAAQLFIYSPAKRSEVWRFVSYMFVHIGIKHITANLIFQLLLGTALEVVHQWWRVAIIYLAGVLAGSMGTSISDPQVSLAGASAGVYALIAAHVATIIINWNEMEYAIIHLMVFVIFCGTDIGTSVHSHYTNPKNGVGYMAHLSGAVAGLLVGIGVLRNLEERKWERKLWWLAITVYFALMLSAIVTHIFYPEYFH